MALADRPRGSFYDVRNLCGGKIADGFISGPVIELRADLLYAGKMVKFVKRRLLFGTVRDPDDLRKFLRIRIVELEKSAEEPDRCRIHSDSGVDFVGQALRVGLDFASETAEFGDDLFLILNQMVVSCGHTVRIEQESE